MKPHKGLQWMRDHVPIFKKMCEQTEQVKASQEEYKKLSNVKFMVNNGSNWRQSL